MSKKSKEATTLIESKTTNGFFGQIEPNSDPKTIGKINDVIKRINSLAKKIEFIQIEKVPIESLYLEYYFLPEEKEEENILMMTSNIIEINNNISQSAQNLIRETIKQILKNNEIESEVNLNVLISNFYEKFKSSGQLIAIALDEKDRPCLINSRTIKRPILAYEVPP